MSAANIALNGTPVQSLQLRVGYVGPWAADIELVEELALDVGDSATLTIGAASLVGTVVTAQSFGLSTGVAIVGGAGGWGARLGPKGYHNDAGIKAKLIAEDAAREAGETLVDFLPSAEHVGADYARGYGVASKALEYAAGGVPWFVDYDGQTYVTERPAGTVAEGAVELLNVSLSQGVLYLAVNDFAALKPGLAISDRRLSAPLTIRDIELCVAQGTSPRASVWVDASASDGNLAALIRSIVSRCQAPKLAGVYRYRVRKMLGDGRADLQSVRSSAGVPDLQAIAQFPGVPGLAAELTAGAEVLVQFVDGDPAAPLITHYVGAGGAGFVPTELVLAGTDGPAAARTGDSVEVLLPPAQFTGLINALPASGVVTWAAPKAVGQIVGGSGKVKIA